MIFRFAPFLIRILLVNFIKTIKSKIDANLIIKDVLIKLNI